MTTPSYTPPPDNQAGIQMDFNTIFTQNSFPVVYRPHTGELWVKIPYDRKDLIDPSRYSWLCSLLPRRPKWLDAWKSYVVARKHFNFITRKLLERFNGVIVLQHYRDKEVCAPACWNAHGLECNCSCMGVNHGAGQPNGRWYILGDTYAVQWAGSARLSCQILLKDSLK